MTATSVDQLDARTATPVAVRTTPRARARRRTPGLIDLPTAMLPALLFLSLLIYVGWASWWF